MQLRSACNAGPVLSYCVDVHAVRAEQLRSELVVREEEMYWLVVQVVAVMHVRSDVAVGAFDWYCVVYSHSVSGEQMRFVNASGAPDSYSSPPQTRRG